MDVFRGFSQCHEGREHMRRQGCERDSPFEKISSKCYKSTFCRDLSLAYTGYPAEPNRGSG